MNFEHFDLINGQLIKSLVQLTQPMTLREGEGSSMSTLSSIGPLGWPCIADKQTNTQTLHFIYIGVSKCSKI